MKRFLITVGILAGLGALGLWYLSWMMSQSLYSFGSVRASTNLRGPLTPPAQHDASSWQVESDIRLSFAAYGEGQPVLVVHGGPGMPYAKAWQGLEALTDHYQFYYYHQRGCGDSTRPFDRFGGNFYENMTELERTLGLGAQIADVERIRQILSLDKVTLIGHSFGGFIAALYAAEFPDRVEELILVAPAGVLTPPSGETDLFSRSRDKLSEEQQAGFDATLAEYLDFGSIFSKSDSALQDVHQRMGTYLLAAMGYDTSEVQPGPPSGGWAVFAMYFSLGKAPDYRSALAEIRAPTLILHGEDDELTLPGSRAYTAIAGSRFVSLEREDPERRAGHFVFDDCPSGFAQAVDEFLSDK